MCIYNLGVVLWACIFVLYICYRFWDLCFEYGLSLWRTLPWFSLNLLLLKITLNKFNSKHTHTCAFFNYYCLYCFTDNYHHQHNHHHNNNSYCYSFRYLLYIFIYSSMHSTLRVYWKWCYYIHKVFYFNYYCSNNSCVLSNLISVCFFNLVHLMCVKLQLSERKTERRKEREGNEKRGRFHDIIHPGLLRSSPEELA